MKKRKKSFILAIVVMLINMFDEIVATEPKTNDDEEEY